MGEVPLGRRVARLSLLSVGLIAFAVGILLLAAWLAHRVAPKEIVGQLPLGADEIPAVSLLVAAGAAAAAFFVGLASLHAAAAMRVLARDRRIPHRSRRRCAGSERVADALGIVDRRLAEEPELPRGRLPEAEVARTPLRLTVLVPAHDEALTIAATLESLWGQTQAPGQVVVVADNCTDDTAEIAREHGAEVFTTVGNTDKKAGALNQALSRSCSPSIERPRRRDGDGRRLGDRSRVSPDGDGAARSGS